MAFSPLSSSDNAHFRDMIVGVWVVKVEIVPSLELELQIDLHVYTTN